MNVCKQKHLVVKRESVIFALAVLGVVVLALLNLFVGAVDIPVGSVLSILGGDDVANASWRFIILESRLPQTITALLSGGALAVCGLLMQAVFRNPLADPSILGVSSGAGLGVALVMLLFGGGVAVEGIGVGGFVAVLVAAFAGALAVTMLMLFVSTMVRSSAMLLIVGVMVGYLSSSAIMLLNYFASADGVRSYMLWGMGNFASVSVGRLPVYAGISIVCVGASLLLVKPLNIFLLGPQYAQNLGVDVRRLRNTILLLTGLLTAVTTSFCGPIAFIGLAVPHIARLLLRTDDYSRLLPATVVIGSLVALLCNLACTLPSGGGVLPINALTPIVGAPVILYIMLRKHL